jgi:hypothetical protein
MIVHGALSTHRQTEPDMLTIPLLARSLIYESKVVRGFWLYRWFNTTSRDRIDAALATNLEPVAGAIVRIPEGSWSNSPKPSIWPRHRPTSQREILDVIAPAPLVRGPVSE